MGLRRGFKTEANWYALQMRLEAGLTALCRLCPWELAPQLGFDVLPLSVFRQREPQAVAHLRSPSGQREFSAITLFIGGKRLIIHNDAHDPKRQASNIAHELAHGILLHAPGKAFAEGQRSHFDPEQEEEANWLGPALLISEEIALHIARSGLSISQASDIYGATHDVVRMRLNVCGARRRALRSRAA